MRPDPVGMERLLEQYFASRGGFYDHQYSSYHAFMDSGLREIITHQDPIQVTHGNYRVWFRFGRVTISHPVLEGRDGALHPVLPRECVDRRATYACGIMADVTQQIFQRDPAGDGDTFTLVSAQTFTEVPISTMPCPVRSRYCWLSRAAPDAQHDALGGYYIINGQEKVIQSQIKLRPNMIHVAKALKSTQGVTTDATGRRLSEHTYVAGVRSVDEKKYKATSSMHVTASVQPGGTAALVATLPFLRCDVSLRSLLRLLEARFWQGPAPDRRRLVTRTVEHLLRVHPARELRRAFDAALDQTLREPTDEDGSDGAALLQLVADQGCQGRSAEERARSLLRLLRCDVLPHLGTEDSPAVWRSKWIYTMILAGKALFAHVLSRISDAQGLGIGDDRDHWINKRAEPAGLLIGVLFRQNFAQWIKGIRTEVHRRLEAWGLRNFRVVDCMAHGKMESCIRSHFATGRWTVMRGVSPAACTGVCAVLNRMTPLTAISCLNRVNVPVNREGKSTAPRQVHTSDWGNVCVVETPEGHGCGLVLNHCMLTHVRVGVDTGLLAEVVAELLGTDAGFTGVRSDAFLAAWDGGAVLVFVNGTIVGCAGDEDGCVARLRDGRRAGDVPPFTSLVHYPGMAVHVNADPGVCMRPVIRVAAIGLVREAARRLAGLPAGAAALGAPGAWAHLLAAGAIEYIDTEEQDAHCVVATSIEAALESPDQYTHCEVQVNLAMMGACANTVPYANHNQSPRIVYQSAMCKQAIGARTPGHARRFDSNLYELHYPQRPLSQTIFDRMCGAADCPASTEAVVLVAPYGYNQEDSIIVNRASVDRGFARATTFATYSDEISARRRDEVFARPDAAAFDRRMADYSRID
ncbi:MAG: hypothetical protein AAFS07_19025, partial [Pseudomonadota bacterium]